MLDVNVSKLWYDYQINKRDKEGPKPTAFDTPFRASDAGACIRKRTLSAVKARESDEFSQQTYMAFDLGNSAHASIQAAFEYYDGDGYWFDAEVPIDLSPFASKVSGDFGLSGHCDGILTNIDTKAKTILEIKTVSGYSAKLHFPYEAMPKAEHLAQAGLYCIGTQADAVMMVYIAKESDWRAGIKAGEIRQWDIPLHENLEAFNGQSVYDLAVAELARFKMADDALKAGNIAAALVPDDSGELHLIEDRPAYGQRGGKPWQCAYCNYATVCRTFPAEEVSVTMIERITE
jgi:hypothetical protein